MRRSKPREFWKLFKSKKYEDNGENVTFRNLLEHFKNLTSSDREENRDKQFDYFY